MYWHDTAPTDGSSLRRLTTSIRSFSGMLLQPERPPDPDIEARTETVRHSMLQLMASTGQEDRSREVCHKIRFATSIESLWYARSDVMTALAEAQGEAIARQRLDDVSRMFLGLLPEARTYRSPRGLR